MRVSLAFETLLTFSDVAKSPDRETFLFSPLFFFSMIVGWSGGVFALREPHFLFSFPSPVFYEGLGPRVVIHCTSDNDSRELVDFRSFVFLDAHTPEM